MNGSFRPTACSRDVFGPLPDALLFDLDGVLADVTGSYRRTIVEVCNHYGVEVEPSQIAAAKSAGDANDDYELTRRLLAERGVEAGIDEVRGRFDTLYRGSGDRPGFRDSESLLADRSLLEHLAATIRMGVVTGRPRRDAESFLSAAAVASLFQVLITREDAPLKPHPAPVMLALARLQPRRAWLLGDTPDDMRAAVAAGVVPVGVVPPGDDPAPTASALRRAGALAVLESVNELGGIL